MNLHRVQGSARVAMTSCLLQVMDWKQGDLVKQSRTGDCPDCPEHRTVFRIMISLKFTVLSSCLSLYYASEFFMNNPGEFLKRKDERTLFLRKYIFIQTCAKAVQYC